MVVAGLEPTCPFMERCGIATGTRRIAARLWPSGVPDVLADVAVRTLYEAENRGRTDPSGSQGMIGLIHPGILRLDYDIRHEGGVFPVGIETLRDRDSEDWLERVLHFVPVAPRPPGYHPLGERRLTPGWVLRLGRSGVQCYEAIWRRDLVALGDSFNECMACWEALLPCTVRHPALTVDLLAVWRHYRQRYPGAMYSGCGGGYLLVASESPVPGGVHATLRRATAG